MTRRTSINEAEAVELGETGKVQQIPVLETSSDGVHKAGKTTPQALQIYISGETGEAITLGQAGRTQNISVNETLTNGEKRAGRTTLQALQAYIISRIVFPTPPISGGTGALVTLGRARSIQYIPVVERLTDGSQTAKRTTIQALQLYYSGGSGSRATLGVADRTQNIAMVETLTSGGQLVKRTTLSALKTYIISQIRFPAPPISGGAGAIVALGRANTTQYIPVAERLSSGAQTGKRTTLRTLTAYINRQIVFPTPPISGGAGAIVSLGRANTTQYIPVAEQLSSGAQTGKRTTLRTLTAYINRQIVFPAPPMAGGVGAIVTLGQASITQYIPVVERTRSGRQTAKRTTLQALKNYIISQITFPTQPPPVAPAVIVPEIHRFEINDPTTGIVINNRRQQVGATGPATVLKWSKPSGTVISGTNNYFALSLGEIRLPEAGAYRFTIETYTLRTGGSESLDTDSNLSFDGEGIDGEVMVTGDYALYTGAIVTQQSNGEIRRHYGAVQAMRLLNTSFITSFASAQGIIHATGANQRLRFSCDVLNVGNATESESISWRFTTRSTNTPCTLILEKI